MLWNHSAAGTRDTLTVLVVILAFANTATAGWVTGDVLSYGQVSWGDDPVASQLLTDNYGSVYAAASDVLAVGWSGGFELSFGDAAHVLAFFPQAGLPGALGQSQTNPDSSESGLFAGDVLALQLDVDFSDAGLLVGTSGIHFGDLILVNFAIPSDINGLTVRQFLADVNIALGGGPANDPINVLDTITEDVNLSFDTLGVTPFAQDHLAAPPSAASAPEPSTGVLLGCGLLGAAFFRSFTGRQFVEKRRSSKAAPVGKRFVA